MAAADGLPGYGKGQDEQTATMSDFSAVEERKGSHHVP